MTQPSRMLIVACAIVALLAPRLDALAQDADGDGIPDDIELKLGVNVETADELILVGESPAKDTSPDLRRLFMCHVAEDRYLWKVEFAEDFPVSGDTMVMYLDADDNLKSGRQDKPEVIGTDVQYSCGGASVGASINNRKIYAEGATRVRGSVAGNSIWVCDDITLNQRDGRAVVRMRLLVQRKGGSDGTDWFAVSVPVFEGRSKSELPGLDTLINKGLTRAQVTPQPGARDNLPERREKPLVPFASEGRVERDGSARRETVALGLLEEAGVARVAELISVGVPLAEGSLFNPAQLRVLDNDGDEAPAQVTITSFWPDDSIRWALVEFLADLDANEACDFAVEYGSEVARAAVPDPVAIDDTGVALIVSTGALQATVSKTRGTFLTNVQTEAAPIAGLHDGLVLVGETGTVYTTDSARPEVRIEKRGPLATTIRVEAPYVSYDGDEYMRAIVRLTFVAGSRTVGVDATHVNDWLETEFTDIRSLTLPVELEVIPGPARFLEPQDGAPVPFDGGLGDSARVMQKHDTLASVSGEERTDLRLMGAMEYQSNEGVGVGVAVLDFWQEYPKALSAGNVQAFVEILPSLEGEDFYEDLPDHLKFPFVEGCYRSKWGMSKTTRMSLDFHEHRQPDESIVRQFATLQHPLIPVISSEVYAATGALGAMAPSREGRFAAWDDSVAERFASFMQTQETDRAYGSFNWGDWYGERGRNWGNNEYDLPHGLFMQFARTGNRDYFRWARTAARHMADVDCVHAHPDIMHQGAMTLHSVCHTGEWSQHLAAPQWSYKYGYHTTAANGHTWADGMVDTWYLTGDPRVMETTIGLGEHIAYAMAPSFEHLGTHERSGGWSLCAAMAIYRATGDPVYLEAARKICEVALAEQDLDNTGAWPHVLPTDHAAGYPGAVGNVAFLIGILMSGMEDYHQATGDPRVLASIQGGCRWLRDEMWIPERWHFHYTSSPTYLNSPGRSSAGCTMLVIDPMAYAARQTGDAELMDIVALAFAAVVRDLRGGFGKSLAQMLFFAPDVMGALDAADESREAINLALRLDPAALRLEQLKVAPGPERLGIREPLLKTVHLLREGDKSFVITATRLPYGARTREMERGTVEFVAPDGTVIKRGDFDTNDEYELEMDLGADAPRGVYVVRMSDDQRSVWDANSSEGKRVIELVDGLALGGIGMARWALYAPPGVTEFTLTVVDWHRGEFGAMVLGPGGEALAACNVVQPAEGGKEKGVLEVKLGANPDGRIVPVVLYTRMDLAVAVEGIPPYLAPNAEAWFNPEDY